jgi:DNA polymerase-1
MARLVVDIEANGLYNDVTEIHCIVAKDIDTGVVYKYDDSLGKHEVNSLREGLLHLKNADKIIGHNFIDYDMRVLDKIYKLKLDVNKIIDTYLLSIMLDPHRKKHSECPPSRLVGDKRVPIGSHSLQNWGYVVGRGKVEQEQWHTFDENMLHRCVEDVEITELVSKKLGVI